VTVGDDQQRRRQPALLEVGQQSAPRRRGFGRRQLQRDQMFLACFSDAEGCQDGDHDHATGHPDAEVEAIEEEHPVALVVDIPLLSPRPLRLELGHDTRDRALRQMPFSQQRFERRANPAAVGAAQIAS
jgi:hypothetical protein